MAEGVIKPSNEAAARWLEMASFDRLKRGNTKSYQRLMLAIIGCPDIPIIAPVLRVDEAMRVRGISAPRRAVRSTPAAGRDQYRVGQPLAEEDARSRGHLPLRPAADRARGCGYRAGRRARRAEKVAAIVAMCAPGDRIRAALTEASTVEFVATLMQTDALLTGDTLALHIASAIGLPTVAVFGPTSPAEIFDFDGAHC